MSSTIYDVARRAGVSTATVSRTLNNPLRVAVETRTRVLVAVDDLDFVPKADAVSRARRGVGRIGVIAPFTSHDAARRRFNGILREAGDVLEVVAYDHPSAAASPFPLLSVLPTTGHLDGLIVMSFALDDAVAARLEARDYPVVLLDTDDERFPSITTNDHQGGRLAARHLVDLGHERIAYLGEAQHVATREAPSTRRLAGLRDHLTESGIPLPDTSIRLSPNGTHVAALEAISLLRLKDRPTAIFASDDIRAAGVLRGAATLGITVPDDLSVIGYDDGDLAETLGLTTVRQPLEESGVLAVRTMRQRLHTTTTPATTTLRVKIITRSTTAPPA